MARYLKCKEISEKAVVLWHSSGAESEEAVVGGTPRCQGRCGIAEVNGFEGRSCERAFTGTADTLTLH